jgi:hypothetical protein
VASTSCRTAFDRAASNDLAYQGKSTIVAAGKIRCPFRTRSPSCGDFGNTRRSFPIARGRGALQFVIYRTLRASGSASSRQSGNGRLQGQHEYRTQFICVAHSVALRVGGRICHRRYQ